MHCAYEWRRKRDSPFGHCCNINSISPHLRRLISLCCCHSKLLPPSSTGCGRNFSLSCRNRRSSSNFYFIHTKRKTAHHMVCCPGVLWRSFIIASFESPVCNINSHFAPIVARAHCVAAPPAPSLHRPQDAVGFGTRAFAREFVLSPRKRTHLTMCPFYVAEKELCHSYTQYALTSHKYNVCISK